DKTLVHLKVLGIEYDLEPLEVKTAKRDMAAPPKSGGLITALYHYRQLLVHGAKGFVGDFSHGGHGAFYLPPPPGARPAHNALRTMAEVLRTRHAGVSTKWYFSTKDQRLLGFEVTIDRDEDPCEVYVSDYKRVDGRMLPSRIQVRHGNDAYAEFT